MKNSGYQASSTKLRLVYGDQCTDLNKVIPDTDGKGNIHGGGGGGGGGSGGGGGGSSGVKKFFLFILVAGGAGVGLRPGCGGADGACGGS